MPVFFFKNYFHHHTQVLKWLALLIQEEDKTSIELTAIPLTTQRKASEHLHSDEDLSDGHEQDDSFTTQQLFSFAWQIARGMVRPRFFHTDGQSLVYTMFT